MYTVDLDSSWPDRSRLSRAEWVALSDRIRPAFVDELRKAKIPVQAGKSLLPVYLLLADWMAGEKPDGKTLVLGVNGAQGTGKSTLCRFLKFILQEAYRLTVVGFSLDDIYRTHAERRQLGDNIHPLLTTRGVPGTHDVQLGIDILRALSSGCADPVAVPVFDKSMDDRRPRSEWPIVKGAADIVIFEGWCVGARPQSETGLSVPVNELERYEDPQGVWRNHVNRELGGAYAELFGMLDRLVMIKAPDMESVIKWRGRQEKKLVQETAARGDANRLMDEAQLKRFIMHYQRLTLHMLTEMPNRADITLHLNRDQEFTTIQFKH